MRVCLRFMRLCFIALCSIALFAAPALAQEPGAGAQTVRPEIGKPIQAAIELIKSKKGKEAIAKVREAQAVDDRTPYENYLVERVLGRPRPPLGTRPRRRAPSRTWRPCRARPRGKGSRSSQPPRANTMW